MRIAAVVRRLLKLLCFSRNCNIFARRSKNENVACIFSIKTSLFHNVILKSGVIALYLPMTLCPSISV